MMIAREVDFADLEYECWGGAEDTLAEIARLGLEDELMRYLEETYDHDYPDITTVNDLLRFDGDDVIRDLKERAGYDEDDESDEDE